MKCVVTIPAISTSYYVMDLPGESSPSIDCREGWEIDDGAWVEVVPNLGEWSDGEETPKTTLCRSTGDRKHYKVFNRPSDVPEAEFEPTGTSFGGTWSKEAWDHFTRNGLPAMMKFYEIPDTDPPGAWEEAMSYLRGAR